MKITLLNLSVMTIFITLTSCVTITPETEEEYIDIHEWLAKTEPKVVVKTRTVGCPPMVMPKLKANPPLPKIQLSSIDSRDNAAIDRILISHIAAQRKVNEENRAIVRRAVTEHNKKCKK